MIWPKLFAPARMWTSLKAMLPLARSGKMRTLARPATGPVTFLVFAAARSRAASTWSSPSMSMSSPAAAA
jgi:hypothetical protein